MSKHRCASMSNTSVSLGEVQMAFSDTLRRLRLERFFSQAELARRSGVHALTVTRLESGRTAPSTRTVRALAEALGVQPGELASPAEVAEADRRERSRALKR
jgi:transcriptional regulator with XRE-family HTH domain